MIQKFRNAKSKIYLAMVIMMLLFHQSHGAINVSITPADRTVNVATPYDFTITGLTK